MNATIVIKKNIQKNKSMKPIYKVMLKAFVAGGIVFAAGQATWDFIDNDNFNQWKFIYHFITFGLFMFLMVKYNYKSKIENNPDSNL
jgi:undecaprenyl pyrophosphate phosphatase UppP